MRHQNKTISHVLGHFKKVESATDGWSARCPAHEDRKNSLSINEADDGKVLLHCHAGCKIKAVVSASGLKMSDLFKASPHRATGKSDIVAEYDYRDEESNVLFQVCRLEPKSFR
jgi:putative DNA primase/helicase